MQPNYGDRTPRGHRSAGSNLSQSQPKQHRSLQWLTRAIDDIYAAKYKEQCMLEENGSNPLFVGNRLRCILDDLYSAGHNNAEASPQRQGQPISEDHFAYWITQHYTKQFGLDKLVRQASKDLVTSLRMFSPISTQVDTFKMFVVSFFYNNDDLSVYLFCRNLILHEIPQNSMNVASANQSVELNDGSHFILHRRFLSVHKLPFVMKKVSAKYPFDIHMCKSMLADPAHLKDAEQVLTKSGFVDVYGFLKALLDSYRHCKQNGFVTAPQLFAAVGGPQSPSFAPLVHSSEIRSSSTQGRYPSPTHTNQRAKSPLGATRQRRRSAPHISGGQSSRARSTSPSSRVSTPLHQSLQRFSVSPHPVMSIPSHSPVNTIYNSSTITSQHSLRLKDVHEWQASPIFEHERELEGGSIPQHSHSSPSAFSQVMNANNQFVHPSSELPIQQQPPPQPPQQQQQQHTRVPQQQLPANIFTMQQTQQSTRSQWLQIEKTQQQTTQTHRANNINSRSMENNMHMIQQPPVHQTITVASNTRAGNNVNDINNNVNMGNKNNRNQFANGNVSPGYPNAATTAAVVAAPNSGGNAEAVQQQQQQQVPEYATAPPPSISQHSGLSSTCTTSTTTSSIHSMASSTTASLGDHLEDQVYAFLQQQTTVDNQKPTDTVPPTTTAFQEHNSSNVSASSVSKVSQQQNAPSQSPTSRNIGKFVPTPTLQEVLEQHGLLEDDEVKERTMESQLEIERQRRMEREMQYKIEREEECQQGDGWGAVQDSVAPPPPNPSRIKSDHYPSNTELEQGMEWELQGLEPQQQSVPMQTQKPKKENKPTPAELLQEMNWTLQEYRPKKNANNAQQKQAESKRDQERGVEAGRERTAADSDREVNQAQQSLEDIERENLKKLEELEQQRIVREQEVEQERERQRALELERLEADREREQQQQLEECQRLEAEREQKRKLEELERRDAENERHRKQEERERQRKEREEREKQRKREAEELARQQEEIERRHRERERELREEEEREERKRQEEEAMRQREDEDPQDRYGESSSPYRDVLDSSGDEEDIFVETTVKSSSRIENMEEFTLNLSGKPRERQDSNTSENNGNNPVMNLFGPSISTSGSVSGNNTKNAKSKETTTSLLDKLLIETGLRGHDNNNDSRSEQSEDKISASSVPLNSRLSDLLASIDKTTAQTKTELFHSKSTKTVSTSSSIAICKVIDTVTTEAIEKSPLPVQHEIHSSPEKVELSSISTLQRSPITDDNHISLVESLQHTPQHQRGAGLSFLSGGSTSKSGSKSSSTRSSSRRRRQVRRGRFTSPEHLDPLSSSSSDDGDNNPTNWYHSPKSLSKENKSLRRLSHNSSRKKSSFEVGSASQLPNVNNTSREEEKENKMFYSNRLSTLNRFQKVPPKDEDAVSRSAGPSSTGMGSLEQVMLLQDLDHALQANRKPQSEIFDKKKDNEWDILLRMVDNDSPTTQV